MKSRRVYLDYAAATPTDKSVIAAMAEAMEEYYANPSASYSAAREAKKAIDGCKARIAKSQGVKPSEIIITSGGTEANNLAIKGVLDNYPGKNLVLSSIEHDSVIKPAEEYKSKKIPVDEQGFIDVDKAVSLIDEETVLVSVMLANNEVGSIQPISELGRKIGDIKKERAKESSKTPLFFHTDACQAPSYLSVEPNRLGVDLMTLNGGKIYGPKNVGLLFIKSGVVLAPQLLGGGHQHGLRSGSESVAHALGLSIAVEEAAKNRKENTKRITELRNYFVERLKDEIPEVIINGSIKRRLPNNLHITLPGADNERMIFELDEAGIMAAAGSACSVSKNDSSHVLRAMGISDEAARSSLRLTMGKQTTKDDIDYVVDVLKQRYNTLKQA